MEVRPADLEWIATAMSFAHSTQFGPCETLAPLEVAGMREVYLARDTRLGRRVAPKLLTRLTHEGS